ncbi:histone acetyltransferase 1 [Physocladia obscura]|uniref:Histone acetyltransferase type B catalytic subunit n=1 Tax=Physocladia obscura TaxID=109957 RepID=A0AAD5SYA9_9FUNG|nr:histone acetyltransferase 1 [Physocladia obscura]
MAETKNKPKKTVHLGDSQLNNLVSEDACFSSAQSKPGKNATDEKRRTFHPQFTYPLFGDEEVLFGYKEPLIRLHFSAGSLFPFLGMKYTYKIDNDPEAIADAKKIGGAVPKADDVVSIVSAKLPKGFSDNYLVFMDQVKRDDQGAFKPMGDKVFEYSVKGRDDAAYEVYKVLQRSMMKMKLGSVI